MYIAAQKNQVLAVILNGSNMLSVREIEHQDIPLIADYWLNSDSDFMKSMGVDLSKLPSRTQWHEMLEAQLAAPIREKQSYATVWLLNGEPVGHCNINKIKFGEEAYMHLHLWQPELRQKGDGVKLAKMSIPYFFEKFELKRLYCEPYALNEAPNKILAKLGFKLVKEHVTIPGYINFEQPVKLWVMEV